MFWAMTGGLDIAVGGALGGLRAAASGEPAPRWEVACAGGEVAKNGWRFSSCVKSARSC